MGRKGLQLIVHNYRSQNRNVNSLFKRVIIIIIQTGNPISATDDNNTHQLIIAKTITSTPVGVNYKDVNDAQPRRPTLC